MKRRTTREAENARPRETQEYQEALFDLTDKYLDEAMRRGEAYNEGLVNWAIDRAPEEIGGAS